MSDTGQQATSIGNLKDADLTVCGDGYLRLNGEAISYVPCNDDAAIERILACWQACKGADTQRLKAGAYNVLKSLVRTCCELESTEKRLAEFVGIVNEWERWEADLIVNGDWSGSTLALTQAQHDSLTVLQQRRRRVMGL